MPHQPWFSQSPEAVIRTLEASPLGLTDVEAKRRLKKYGPNTLPESDGESLFTLFIKEFQSPLIYVLIVAAVIMLFLHETTDSLIVFAVLLLNAIIGTIQEGKANNTLRALRHLSQTRATVLRSGQQRVIPDTELVPGDIIFLNEGEKIPADARIIESFNLTVNESSLTGESLPVHKVENFLGQKQPYTLTIGDQLTMTFKGSYVTSGRGQAIVVATGLNTEIGKIAQSVQEIDTDIPLKRAINDLTKFIIIAVSLVTVLIFILGLLEGEPLASMFSTAVSLAVASIPEGLPVVLTIVLATGVWRMSKRNALVKKLEAVEALGQTTVITVDKTGTITRNELMLTTVHIGDTAYTITGAGYDPKGTIGIEGNRLTKLPAPLLAAAEVAAVNATAQVAYDRKARTWQVNGDPTEAALLIFAEKAGIKRDLFLRRHKLVLDAPFDYTKKYRAAAYRDGDAYCVTAVGAPESIYALCHMTASDRTEATQTFHTYSQHGQRVLAFATAKIPHIPSTKQLPKLTFGGFFAMQDGLHQEVRQTVEQVHAAGIKIAMITGDHPETALAIAREAGIATDTSTVLTGHDLEVLSLKELRQEIKTTTVYARVTPEHKMRIIQAFRSSGNTVAMTGDGVNDAPSLVSADLGIAMGITGTEVAKEAADIVLLDDNFKSIVAAIEEGRNIYRAIQKVVGYLFSTNIGEILTIGGGLLLGFSLVITPVQIIWMNLVTDGFLNVGLAMEKKETNLLNEHWTRKSKQIIDRAALIRMSLVALVMAAGTLWMYSRYIPYGYRDASTVVLTTLCVYQWFNAWTYRHATESVFRLNPISNRPLILATLTVIVLQFTALHVPFFQHILDTQPLTVREWGTILLVASSTVWVDEIRKWAVRRHTAPTRANEQPKKQEYTITEA